MKRILFLPLLMVSAASHADTAADVTAAFTGAQTNLGLVVTGVIALTALVTGVGLIVSFLRK